MTNDKCPRPTFESLFEFGGDLDPEGELMAALPHAADIGIRLHHATDGQAVLSAPWASKLVGDPETGVMHGGVVTVLLDTSCGTAVMSVRSKIRSTATLDLRIDYMRPATTGRRIYCHAECYRMTRSIGFTRAVAFHEKPEDPVATASGAFMLDRKEDAE